MFALGGAVSFKTAELRSQMWIEGTCKLHISLVSFQDPPRCSRPLSPAALFVKLVLAKVCRPACTQLPHGSPTAPASTGRHSISFALCWHVFVAGRCKLCLLTLPLLCLTLHPLLCPIFGNLLKRKVKGKQGGERGRDRGSTEDTWLPAL